MVAIIKHESYCVDCGFPCRGLLCGYYDVAVKYCDRCGRQSDELYIGRNGDELCESCALGELDKAGSGLEDI